ncbi:MAG: N-methyl-L-tryptophan oxidase [Abitibacteriaceae bacterium]|nr:N-methyl-L-tryptophan oxidase [Abditibacteriaceae bacterium]
MAQVYDVIVIGLGGMGSAAAYQLASRGQRVLGLERHTPVHHWGSSHGQSRIIRQAYFEDPAYVPLLLRAYELWKQLEREVGQELLTITGGLMLGPPNSEVILGSIRSAQEHNLPHEIWDASEIKRRFPPLQPDAQVVALYEEQAGFVHPEAAVRSYLQRAEQLGAILHFEEPVTAWTAAPSGDGVRVTTAQGTYEAGRLVIAPGAWAPEVLSSLGLPLEVQRQVMYWFDPLGGVEPFSVGHFPIYIWDCADGAYFYGFPAHNGPQGGVKVAFHTFGTPCTPNAIDREVDATEIERMRSYLASRIPALNSVCLNAVTCMYTNTPDQHFVIALHPQHPQVAIAAGFSGHGFKFASVVGEILADLVMEGATRHPTALFAPQRLITPGVG